MGGRTGGEMGPTTPRILLVDDERTFRAILARALRARGYAVAEAASGAEALAAIRGVPPALLLLDVHLPDMTGWDVLRRLAAAGPVTVPTIVLSAAAPAPDPAARHGSTFLAKPFALAAFLHLVADTLAGAAHARSSPPWGGSGGRAAHDRRAPREDDADARAPAEGPGRHAAPVMRQGAA